MSKKQISSFLVYIKIDKFKTFKNEKSSGDLASHNMWMWCFFFILKLECIVPILISIAFKGWNIIGKRTGSESYGYQFCLFYITSIDFISTFFCFKSWASNVCVCVDIVSFTIVTLHSFLCEFIGDKDFSASNQMFSLQFGFDSIGWNFSAWNF